jgi:hypothetical protein
MKDDTSATPPPRPDERAWVRSLNDRELGQLARALTAVDRAVRDYRKATT